MKKSTIAILTAMMPFFATAQQIYSQQVPEAVKEIRVEGLTLLRVKSTTGNAELQSTTKEQVASIKSEKLTIKSDNGEITLMLPVGQEMRFSTEDHSSIMFDGSFNCGDYISIHSEDHSTVNFAGDDNDSLYAENISIRTEDYSTVNVDVRFTSPQFTLRSEDYSTINIPCMKPLNEQNIEKSNSKISIDDNARINIKHCPNDSIDFYFDSTILYKKGRNETQYTLKTASKNNNRYKRELKLDLGIGFNNWGDKAFGIFDENDGASSISTGMRNFSLSVNFPIAGTRHLGLYIGAGVEWDKYKFETSEILFNTTTSPYSFSEGTNNSCATHLRTRYATIPISLQIDFGRSNDWSLTLSALPGLNWNGKKTGLRREYSTNAYHKVEKDHTIDRNLMKYKLDFRAALQYGGVGLFAQFSTISLLNKSSEELYPFKFGFIFSID